MPIMGEPRYQRGTHCWRIDRAGRAVSHWEPQRKNGTTLVSTSHPIWNRAFRFFQSSKYLITLRLSPNRIGLG